MTTETKCTLDMMKYVEMEKDKLLDKAIDKNREIRETDLEFLSRQWRVAIHEIKKAIMETHSRIICIVETWLREHGFIK